MNEEFQKESNVGELVDNKVKALRKPTIAQVCGLYSLAVILLIYIGFKAQRISAYPGLLITEFILILLPSLILVYIYK